MMTTRGLFFLAAGMIVILFHNDWPTSKVHAASSFAFVVPPSTRKSIIPFADSSATVKTTRTQWRDTQQQQQQDRFVYRSTTHFTQRRRDKAMIVTAVTYPSGLSAVEEDHRDDDENNNINSNHNNINNNPDGKDPTAAVQPSAESSSTTETTTQYNDGSDVETRRWSGTRRNYQYNNGGTSSSSSSSSSFTRNNNNNTETYGGFWEEQLSITSFNMDLRNLASDDPQKAQDALEIMEALYDRYPNSTGTVQPDATCYTTVLEGWLDAADGTHSSSSSLAPSTTTTTGRNNQNHKNSHHHHQSSDYYLQKAQDVLNRMERMEDEARRAPYGSQPVSPQPTEEEEETPTKANSISPVLPLVAPTSLTYMLMIQAWANDHEHDFQCASAERAESLMRRMQQRGFVQPDVRIWSVVLDGWCKRASSSSSRLAIQRANAILQEMEESYIQQKKQQKEQQQEQPDQQGENISSRISSSKKSFVVPRPNVVTYTNFLGGLARSKLGNLASQAEGVLERMERHGVEADMVAYTSVLNCWSKAVSRRERSVAATRALKIISRMERLYAKEEKYHVKPSLITYSTAIRAVANSLDPNAPVVAQTVLDRMYKLQQFGIIANAKPTTAIYNAVLYAFGCARSPADRLKYAKRSEQLLKEMTRRAQQEGEKDVAPDVRTWAAVLRAWAQCRQPDAAEQAQRVLNELEDLSARGETVVRPNFVCYTTVMGAWGHSRRKDALDNVDRILKKMESQYEETLEANVRPNTVSYVTAIDAFVRKNEKDAARRAQATVDRMVRLYRKGLGHVRPTRIVFNTLIHAWSKSPDPDAPKQAEDVFKWMEAQYQQEVVQQQQQNEATDWMSDDCHVDNSIRPDEVSLCAILNTWANQGTDEGAERAQQIWEHMKSLSMKERGFPVTIQAANIVIKAIARSRDPHAARKAEQILLQLEEDYQNRRGTLRPDVTTYSSVINACAYCTGDAEARAEAFEIAFRSYQKIREGGASGGDNEEKPNNITFGTLFKAIANLLPPVVGRTDSESREEMVRQLFDECCDSGNVDGFVLSQLRHASRQVYQDLVEEPCGLAGPNADTNLYSVLQNIPPEWSANVVE